MVSVKPGILPSPSSLALASSGGGVSAPEPPRNLDIKVERQWDGGGFEIQYVSYQVEDDERAPKEGPFDTGAFYRRHPNWSAVGKYMYDSRIALTVLADRSDVNAERIGVTGHSLGGQGSIWLPAYDDRIRCAAPSCAATTFRKNPNPLAWSRDRWYIYFPQLREEFLAGRKVQCDIHEMMSLIAPRPLLEQFALNDGPPETPGESGWIGPAFRVASTLWSA